MFKPIRDIFSGKSGKKHASLPAGQRVYAIGDIHGRHDLFDELIKAIEADDKDAGPAETTVILMGDLIDRGPDSAGVVKLARLWEEYRNVRYLAGNHEEMFLESFKDTDVLRHFLKHGGRETILSYGVTKKEFNTATLEDLQIIMKDKVPKSDRKFMKAFEDMIIIGDYLFVHAGVNPKRELDDQKARELRWIRDPFLNHKDRYAHMIVHGHTIFEDVDERKNRIGIDTGAYRFGKLTAIVLEGTERRYVQAVEKKKGGIKIVKKDSAK